MKSLKDEKQMERYVCSVCGYVYDEEEGIPETGILPETRWEELPHEWVCPLCGASREEFKKKNDSIVPAATKAIKEDNSDQTTYDLEEIKELSPIEMSALCSNLARGCEKQYMLEESSLFQQLASYFKSISEPAEEPKISVLLDLIEKDLGDGFPNANLAANSDNDRGALRALVWSEKVTRILKSLILRYQKEKVLSCTQCVSLNLKKWQKKLMLYIS